MGNENYCECLVRAKDSAKYRLLMIVGAVGALVCAFAAMFIWLFAMLPMVALGVLAWYSARRIRTEYEYLLLDHELSVDVIYNKDRRKQQMSCPTKTIDMFVPADPGKLDHLKRQNIVPADYSTGNPQDAHYILVCSGEGKRQACLVTPDEEMLLMMGRELPRNVLNA